MRFKAHDLVKIRPESRKNDLKDLGNQLGIVQWVDDEFCGIFLSDYESSSNGIYVVNVNEIELVQSDRICESLIEFVRLMRGS